MQITIKQITGEDAAAIAGLSQQLGYGATTVATAQRIAAIGRSKDHCGFAAMASGELVGWIHGFHTMRLESDPFVEIGGLVVEAGHRGKGIGLLLIEQVKSWARQRQVNRIRVRCNSTRTDTHAFYRHLGFTENKTQQVFDQFI